MDPIVSARRDLLRQIEHQVQAEWAITKPWEVDAPDTDDNNKNKYMITFPYPYMNGCLHLGHAFTITKADFGAGYQRHLGKKVLFPFAYHATGMPIKACADKLRWEIEKYGNPPQFPETLSVTKTIPNKPIDPFTFKSSKSKAQSKTIEKLPQWIIMQQMGIPDHLIPLFVDPNYWLQYFPPLAQSDLTSMGCKIDHRRSFITTPLNPYYDSFVKWQYNKLYSQNLCQFGKKYMIWSPLSNQPCADHERSEGEGVQPQLYTLIKLPITKPYPEILRSIQAPNTIISIAMPTLCPENIYGLTNCWINPDEIYGAYSISVNSIIICSEKIAYNLAHQGYTTESFGKLSCLKQFEWHELVGISVCNPLSTHYPTIRLLPLPVSDDGIEMCVPSVNPFDYYKLALIKNMPGTRNCYKEIPVEWVESLEPVKFIQTKLGDCCAQTVCERDPLQQTENDSLHNACLKLCFTGTLMVGDYAGQPVNKIRTQLQSDLFRYNLAIPYAQPAQKVVSRSDDLCVVALADQWFLSYGEGEWLNRTRQCLDQIHIYNDASVQEKFNSTLSWLNSWAFSRTFGLGTQVPWDPTYLIESLSDSTIYPAYYTLAHLLQNESLDGSTSVIPIEFVTDSFWDYVFGLTDIPPNNLNQDILNRMRREFEFWYPYDVRVSGRDLIPNHLTFSMYHHVALFEPKYWPKGVRINGFLLLNGEKMSKCLGNFMTLREAIELYSSDAMRLGLAEAGDTVNDSDLTNESVYSHINRLNKLIEFVQSTRFRVYRTGQLNIRDKIMLAHIEDSIQTTTRAYELTNYRQALISGFINLLNFLDNYLASLSEEPHTDIINRYVEVQLIMLEPFAPHICYHLWKNVLEHSDPIYNVQWPTPQSNVKTILEKEKYLQTVISEIRHKINLETKSGKMCQSITIIICDYPVWYNDVKPILEQYQEQSERLTKIKSLPLFVDHKRDLQMCIQWVKELADSDLTLNEEELLRSNIDYLLNTLNIKSINIVNESEIGSLDLPPQRKVNVCGRSIKVSLHTT